MLIGEYIHTIDQKNRVSVPVKFRKELGRKVIITPGLDNCLFVFNMKGWEKVAKRLMSSENDLSFLRADQRSFNRNMFGQAMDVEIDSIGRILLPDVLKDKIKPKNSVAIIGVEDRLEIWNDEVWKSYKEKARNEAEALAEKLAGRKDE
ncbi:division/cell wall cluster transcriptional repressor MraZ [Candidatus Nomurabacteria bacterium RIFCSPLOWO2_01_FULL_41_21]|uniref:Transcriptional regulator MraZ n=2 Tax=Candidatus Nomuraibacteriota TaxID=1752729 RepID=A0A1F6V1Y6_9BACT|nr:MAG: division/cell wall cluster transcriptional repressor MraZ [Candidatus Nomurabacteria bacterium RIFCSPHIGHO2_01_FULL_40_20]OGI88653.1 MAG: division/cell wall cluster transcriptional repressor MraZ [Candidatus Nomurabacteria bacterium RIFCSPLOWO2_01_FULL_41_21]